MPHKRVIVKHVTTPCAPGLQVDTLDLVFCHRPDPNTLIEERTNRAQQ